MVAYIIEEIVGYCNNIFNGLPAGLSKIQPKLKGYSTEFTNLLCTPFGKWQKSNNHNQQQLIQRCSWVQIYEVLRSSFSFDK